MDGGGGHADDWKPVEMHQPPLLQLSRDFSVAASSQIQRIQKSKANRLELIRLLSDVLSISIKKCSYHYKHYKRHFQDYTSDQELHLSFGTMLSLIIHLLLGDYHRRSNYNWWIPDFVKIDR